MNNLQPGQTVRPDYYTVDTRITYDKAAPHHAYICSLQGLMVIVLHPDQKPIVSKQWPDLPYMDPVAFSMRLNLCDREN